MHQILTQEDRAIGRDNMTKSEQKRFRDVLRKTQVDLEKNGISGREALAIEVCADELDRTQHAQERDLAMGGLDRNARRLREVRTALSRIDAGTFGICLDCEKEISMKRLSAMPWTASCIVCQEAAETVGQPCSTAGEMALAAD